MQADIFHYNRGISKHWDLQQLSLMLSVQPHQEPKEISFIAKAAN